MATLDHIGLNRYIYMSASVDEMTLGSHTLSDISNSAGASILGTNLDDSRILLGINLYNNGPYGYSSWQQLRMSENPLSRHLRKNNQYPIVRNGKERVYFRSGKRYVVPDRYGTQLVLDEPAIISNYKPISLVGSLMDYNDIGINLSINLTKKISMNNNIAYFTNENINNIAGLVEKPDEVYEVLKGYYLEEALNSADSPMSSFEKLIFEQTIYPPQQYTYKSYTRARTTFSFNWNSNINSRQQSNVSNNFGLSVKESSIWPLDVDPNWVNFSTPLIENLGIKGFSGTTHSSSFGILWNHYSQVSEDLSEIGGTFLLPDSLNDRVRPAPLYSRRHGLIPSESCVAPTGKTSLVTTDLSADTIFGGEASWDVPRQSGKYPFYDSYSKSTDEVRLKAKDYTIVPEFKMSEHVAQFLSSSIFNTPDTIFDIVGSKENITNSSKSDFYQIYSNSDFLKNFDIILEDHKDFTDPSKITLKCKAYKKLIPYNGFYPVQRTVDLAEQFYSSYSDFIVLSSSTSGGGFGRPTGVDSAHGLQNILTPLFAPGVLYNSIKSGVAVDYPIITGSLSTTSSSLGGYLIQNPIFDKRIPFEALLEPEKHLSNYPLICNEPHPSGNVSSSAFWSGQGNELYSRMANNFVAEIPNFFLKGEQFTTLASAPQNDPNFGQVKLTDYGTFGGISEQPEVYTMRIKMYRSMDGANTPVTSSANNLSYLYIPPQDIVASGIKETITMYSRPSAFGPPWEGPSIDEDSSPDPYLSVAGGISPNSLKGLNYPFTPPYYHGQAWADVSFRPTEAKKYTVSEILASCSVNFYRFDELAFTTTGSGFVSSSMNLDASLNLFSKGTLGETTQDLQSLSPFNIQVDDQSKARWIIQPKFETPILNFNHLDKSESDGVTLPNSTYRRTQVPIGMWHQYGRIPTETEGIYLQVTDIPIGWARARLRHGNYHKTGSLADLCGFSQNPVKLGQINDKKKISECVVAVPFVEESGVKKFFKLNENYVKNSIDGNVTPKDETLDALVDKLKRFIFPPSFDFLNFPEQADPVAMYAFEFSSYLSQQDLADIWQNVLPNIGRSHEESEASISHSLFGKNKFINRESIRDDVRWMVFKVKQRAASRYYDQIYKKKGTKLTDLISEVSTDSAGPRSKIQYNWPYDFFSLVELVKIDASIEFSDVETDDNGNETVVPKVATDENARIQLDTLFPKGKK